MYAEFQFAYLSVLFFVTVFSVCLVMKKVQQEYLYIYLTVSFLLDFLMYCFQLCFTSTANFGFLYNIYILFCGVFFLIYFNRDQTKHLKTITTLFFCAFLATFSIYIFNGFVEINQVIGIAFSFLYISYSMIWFYGKIMKPNKESILDDPKFWVSCGLLFWGVFFILRVIPRYLFDKVDEQLLLVSQLFFFIINMVFYSLLFVSLLKYKKKTNE